jgi:peptidoglycan/xylan/chitin deacetylase (PgdA/CDA1 family)
MKTSTARDYAGCSIKSTFFLQNQWTNYLFVEQARAMGCEIATHSVTHTTGSSTDAATWQEEMLYSKEYTAQLTQTPISEIVGWRFPFFAYNEAGWQTMAANFQYDSSIEDIYGITAPFALYWPYTLDYGAHVVRLLIRLN